MFKALKLIITVSIVSLAVFFGYQTHTEPQVRHNSLAHRLTYPTDTRVRYRIGDVDARFGLTHDDVKRLTAEAVQIWHDGTNKEWFIYDDDAKLTINLIYDERQIETNARQQIKQNLNDLHNHHQMSSESLQKRHKQLNAQFHALETELDLWHSDYQKTINRLRDASDDQERQALTQKHEQLLTKQRLINEKINAYQSAQNEFNQAVDKFNAQTNKLNQSIDQANARLTAREFHKGEFRHGGDTFINVYEFENTDELRLTLAHELGHALYLDHNDDPTALMYPYAQKQQLKDFKLKQADIDLLENRQFYK